MYGCVCVAELMGTRVCMHVVVCMRELRKFINIFNKILLCAIIISNCVRCVMVKGRSGRIAHLTFRRAKKILNTKESVRN